MKTQSFRDLEVWKQGMSLAETIYKMTRAFPKDELFGLTSQMRRASVSIPSNIAEGWGRGRKEYVHFLTIANGSCCELETQSLLCYKIGLISKEVSSDVNEKIASIGRLLKLLQKSLKAPLAP